MEIKNTSLDITNKLISESQIGVVIGRFQTNTLHSGHLALLDKVMENHKKVIILVGISRIQNTKKNPLDFASRKAMIQKIYPNLTILPLIDQRYNEKWSKEVDKLIQLPYGNQKTVIYGSRDSFIPYYSGKLPVVELEEAAGHNASNIRGNIARETLDSDDFRAGIIYSTHNNRPVNHPTVDVCVFNDKGEILLARKPNEKYLRFIGGFVDTSDKSLEEAARREFKEETGGNCEIAFLKYIMSHKVEDWRYNKEESGIMTTLFLAEKVRGFAIASDDIQELKWLPIKDFSNFDGIRTKIMVEHREMMTELVDQVYLHKLIPNIGERLMEREGNITYNNE